MSSQSLAICLVGPTAAGKTEIALQLAERFPCDIISVDSAMVYRHMDIGTAKPGSAVLEKAPHGLIDILDPWERYSAGQFCIDARSLIDTSVQAGRTPLLVGGTLMYFRALQQGLAPLPQADADLRVQLDKRGSAEGWPALHAELAIADPEAAKRIQPNDRQRIQRALEVFLLTGEAITDLQNASREPASGIVFERIALLPSDRSVLHRRIEQRFRQMMEAGFLEEVEHLRGMHKMHADCPSMRAVGYRQLWEFLDGQDDLATATTKAIVATRRLAKRQLTWLRAEADQHTHDCLASGIGKTIGDRLAERLSGNE
jgi:tRNA dimethylallyltransferase